MEMYSNEEDRSIRPGETNSLSLSGKAELMEDTVEQMTVNSIRITNLIFHRVQDGLRSGADLVGNVVTTLALAPCILVVDTIITHVIVLSARAPWIQTDRQPCTLLDL